MKQNVKSCKQEMNSPTRIKAQSLSSVTTSTPEPERKESICGVDSEGIIVTHLRFSRSVSHGQLDSKVFVLIFEEVQYMATEDFVKEFRMSTKCIRKSSLRACPS